jgi:hypothetical protein
VQIALRVLPTLGSCALLMWTMARTQHPLALPGALLAIVAAFHGVLLAAGVSLQEAQDAGWVLKPAVRGVVCWGVMTGGCCCAKDNGVHALPAVELRRHAKCG